jgi:GrpB-like predicted nucleotidyltransferase (UPF0157 family)
VPTSAPSHSPCWRSSSAGAGGASWARFAAAGRPLVPKEDAPIRLSGYDPRWVRLFDAERVALEAVLAPWLRGPIEHVGSTAVPGLAAKPVIDIMAAVGTLEESRGAIAALRGQGYQYSPYRADEMHWFCKPGFSFRTHHLHLVPRGSALWTARIVFRDRLRADPGVAARYAELKRRLAAEFEHDREAYTDGKGEFVERIVAEAASGSGRAASAGRPLA